MRGVVALVLLAVILAGCSSLKERTSAKPGAFAGIKTIQVEDKTSPVLLRASEAGLVSDLIEAALKGNGYQTCTAPCAADAMATVTVKSYSERISYNPHIQIAAPASVIVFTFQVRKGGTILMETESRKKTSMPLNDLAAILVQDLAKQIPETK